MGERRVVVTGMGAVTALGFSVAAFWDGLVSGRSGIARIVRFDPAAFDVHIAGQCAGFDPAEFMDPRRAKRMDRFAQMAFAAAKMAVSQAGLEEKFDPHRAGVIIGTGIGGLAEIEDQYLRMLRKGPGKVSAFTIPRLMANASPGHISIEFGFRGINTSISTACASAGNAMGDALHAVRRNEADVMITGGTEAAVTPLGIAAFSAMKAISTRNHEPERASRPFDRDRDGFVLSEGAGLLVFEEYQHAKARGAPILCEVVGIGTTADASDIVQPDPTGAGAACAMNAAIRDARLNPEDIDYINAHGTSTPLGDIAETRAIKTVFGPAARKLAISSTKSAIGHLLGASGGVEGIATVKTLQHQILPPTINLDNSDPECDLDYVPNTARDARVRTAMSNSFGFGGHNVCIIFRTL